MVFVLIIGLSLSCAGFFGMTGDGNVISRDLSGLLESGTFTKVSIEGIGNVRLVQGNTYSIQVTTDANLLEYLTLKFENDTLRLGIRYGVNISHYTKLDYVLILPELTDLHVSGAADVESVGTFSEDALSIRSSGTATINFAATCLQMAVNISGTANITLTGTANTLDYDSSGVGEFDAFEFPVQNAELNISGTGNAKIYVNNRLNVVISGLGTVYYKGSPVITQNITGLGSINQSL